MARPRKPTAALELEGAFKKNPKRGVDRKNEPKPDADIGKAPTGLDAKEKTLWDELTAVGYWLTKADRLLLEITVRLMVSFRKNELDGGGISKLITSLAKLGFSPTDRSKIQAPGAKDEEEDPYAEFK